jgi:zinc protease
MGGNALAIALALVGCGGTQSHASTAPENPPAATPDAGVSSRLPDDEMRPPTAEVTHRPIPVVQLRNEASPLVTFRVLFEAGSADDPTGREGATHLAAKLMTDGGTEALTYEQLTRRLFPMAAQINVSVDRDMTVFVGQVHRDRLDEYYELFRDVLLHPRMADEDFRRVRTQTLSALTLELRGNDDEELGKEMLQSLIYAGHPYGHPALGTERGLNALTLDEVRAQRERTFCRDRVSLGLAGGYPAAFADRIAHDLEQLPAHCADAITLAPPARPSGMHVVVIDKPDASATAISFGFPITITRNDADFAPLQFATDYLGLHRQSSGVLYQLIREQRGLNYGDYAYAEYFEQDSESRFPATNIQRREQYASVWLRPVRPTTAHFALRAATRALARMLEQGIAQPDFDRTRTFLTGYIHLFAQTESLRLGYALDDAWNHASGPSYLDRTRAAWESADRDAVNAAARRHLTAHDVWVAIVAPNARELADAIGRNAPSPITYDTPKPASVLAEDREIQAYALPVRAEDVRVVPLAEVFR